MLYCFSELYDRKGAEMSCLSSLPEGYREIFSINLQKDKKAALLVNGIGLVIILALCVIGHLIVPISALLAPYQGPGSYFARPLVLLGGIIIYIILHELVHGIAMKYFGAGRVKFGFTGMYAFAGSEDYFYKKPYIVIALAPVVIWGAVLLVINCFVGDSWFWVVYLIQVTNLSGAAGDIYVTYKFSKMPEDILVRDAGVSMTVYSR